MTLIQKIVVFLGFGPVFPTGVQRPIPVRVQEDKSRGMCK
jgi:hypothetical protein